MKRAIIVVPIYKNILADYEQIAIRQLFAVLGNHPICYVAPASLECSFLNEYGKDFYIKYFDDCFFKNIDTYSQLCMSTDFYEAFAEYEYMLIYQTDAFCFADRLEEFCSKGYDFIGAPIPKSQWRGANFYVGNGGFSLRRIQSFKLVLENKDKILEMYASKKKEPYENLNLNVEDQFFAYCTGIKELDFHSPDVDEALTFSVEYNINGVYIDIANHLPFGCHRWMFYKYKEWKKVIEKYGYSLESIEYNDACDYAYNIDVVMYSLENENNIKYSNCLRKLVRWNRVVLWGAGRAGRRCKRILEKYDFDDMEFWDSRASLYDDNVTQITEEMLINNTVPIIISVKDYSEIEQQLLRMGKREGTDYLVWYKVLGDIAEQLEIDKYGEYVS